MLGIHVGDPLDREAIRAGVQALFASQEVEDVRVEVTPEEGGFALIVHAQVASRVSSVQVINAPARQRALVMQELGLAPGLPLRVSQFELALARAEQALRSDGFPQAELEPELNFQVEAGTVDVKVWAKLGPPRVLCRLQAEGLAWEQDKLWKACDAKLHRRLTNATLEGMRRRLLSALRREGHWQAEVEGPTLAEAPCGTEVRFAVRPGPKFALQVDGVPLPPSLLLEGFPFLSGEDGYFPGSEDWLANRLRQALQRKGYLLAQVTVKLESTQGETPRLVVQVEKGPRLSVKGFRFPGLPPEAQKLAKKVTLSAGLSRLLGLSLDDDQLAAQADSLLQALQGEGFAQARVDKPQVVKEGKGCLIYFPVELGEPWVVEEVEIGGWPEGLPLPPLPLKAGGPWSEGAQEESRKLLLGELANAGFPEATVAVTSRCQAQRCRPLFSVSAGDQVRVGQVVVAGLGKTRPEVVEVVGHVQKGDLFSSEGLLEAQRRLLALGIFQRVTLKPIPGQESGAERGLLVQVQESPSRSLSGGIGWDTEEKLRLSGSWVELNLFGRARTLSLEGRFSSRQRRLQVNYREPGKLGLFGLPTWVAVYRTEESFPTYSLLRRGMWVELGDHLQRPKRMLLRYDYQIIAPQASADVLSSLERTRQNLKVASLTPILEWDTRDDIFSPSRGLLASLQVQRAFPLFLADASFAKFQGSFSLFSPWRSTVLALGLRGGAIKPYQGDPHTPDNLRIPIAVRFFAGGRVSHRAFATDRLGFPGQTLLCPRDNPQCPLAQREPVGGAAQVLGSLEWRVPLAGALGATLFLDSGNTWASVSQVQWRQLRWGAGLGLRFATPVGPLRLEYGWKLDRQEGESKGELFLAFGNPF
jgi:outer membrane protein insertion porin family